MKENIIYIYLYISTSFLKLFIEIYKNFEENINVVLYIYSIEENYDFNKYFIIKYFIDN